MVWCNKCRGHMGEVAGDETEDTGSASECFLRNAKRFRLYSLRNGATRGEHARLELSSGTHTLREQMNEERS